MKQMNKLKRYLILSVLIGLVGVVSSCNDVIYTDEYIQQAIESGELTEIVIDSVYFDKIDAGCKYYIEYSQSTDAPCVVAVVETSKLPVLDIRVQDSTLIAKIATCDSLGMDKDAYDSILWNDNGIVPFIIRCNSNNLRSIHTVNNPTIRIASLFKTDKLDVDMEAYGKLKNDATLNIKELNIKTSGEVKLFGNVDSANIAVLAGGRIHSPGLDINDLKLDISTDDNGRDCKVGIINNTLDLLIVGSTVFTYKGEPRIINQYVDKNATVINE